MHLFHNVEIAFFELFCNYNIFIMGIVDAGAMDFTRSPIIQPYFCRDAGSKWLISCNRRRRNSVSWLEKKWG